MEVAHAPWTMTETCDLGSAGGCDRLCIMTTELGFVSFLNTWSTFSMAPLLLLESMVSFSFVR